jgi:hypothetical protein
MSALKRASYVGIGAGSALILGLLLLFLFPDPVVNWFVKPRIARTLAEAFPGSSIHMGHITCNILQNHLACDSISLRKNDETLSITTGALTVRGMDWLKLLRGRSPAREGLAGAIVDARDLVLTFPRFRYEFRCLRMRLSVPDSGLAIDSLTLRTLAGDEDFFGVSTFRRTRFTLTAPQLTVEGLACLAALEGKHYHARSIRLEQPSIDVLTNKDQPVRRDTSRLLMPGEVLSSIPGNVRVAALAISNGCVTYGERFAVGGRVALITTDSMQVLIEGIDNGGQELVLEARGRFMKVATMNLRMLIPLGSPEFSMHYSGSIGTMDISVLNAFLETAEHIRVKTGILETATFEINVASGRAGGSLRAIYRNFTLAAINKRTGSEKGFSDGVASFIANTFKIHGTNTPNKAGVLKIGNVKYTRKPEEPFLRFAWFALRSGLKDVVGF